MRIRQQRKHGNLRWVVDYKGGKGKRHQKSFKERPDAVEFANTVTTDTPTKASGPTITVRELFARYAEQTASRRTEGSQRGFRYKAEQALSALDDMGVRFASQINPSVWPRLVKALSESGLSYHSVVCYSGTYSAVMRWAQDRGFLHENQAGEMEMRKPQRGRKRYLSRDEINTLLTDVKGHWLELPTALGIYQGLRRREVCELTGDAMDRRENTIAVLESKNRDWRVCKIHSRLRPILQKHHAFESTNNQPVCTNLSGEAIRPDWLTHAFKHRVRALAERREEKEHWEDVSFHILRHTCASQMALSGNFTLYEIAKFLGHKSIQTTQQYAHLMPDQVEPEW